MSKKSDAYEGTLHTWQAAELCRLLNVKPEQGTMNRLNGYAQQMMREEPACLAAARECRAIEGEEPWALGIRMVRAALNKYEVLHG